MLSLKYWSSFYWFYLHLLKLKFVAQIHISSWCEKPRSSWCEKPRSKDITLVIPDCDIALRKAQSRSKCSSSLEDHLHSRPLRISTQQAPKKMRKSEFNVTKHIGKQGATFERANTTWNVSDRMIGHII